MHTLSSASRTFIELASAVEWTATVLIPISRHARCTRSAISPRLAISTFSNIRASRHLALSARLRGEREGTHRGRDGEGEVGCAVGENPPPHPDPLRPQGRRGRIPAPGISFPIPPQCCSLHPHSKIGSHAVRSQRFEFHHPRYATRVGHDRVLWRALPPDTRSRRCACRSGVADETVAADQARAVLAKATAPPPSYPAGGAARKLSSAWQSLDQHQDGAILDRLRVGNQDLRDAAGAVGADLVHHLHR